MKRNSNREQAINKNKKFKDLKNSGLKWKISPLKYDVKNIEMNYKLFNQKREIPINQLLMKE